MVGTSQSSFGKGLRKRKPSYQISEESEEESSNNSHDTGSYEVNYNTKVTHKPGPSSYDTGSYKFTIPTTAPVTKTKFGSNNKFSSFNHQGSGSAQSGIFKFNEPQSSSGLSNGQITTKFAINHPAPTHSADNLGGSYQTYSDEGFGSSSGQLNEQFISDYHTTLAKLNTDKKSEKKKFQSSSPFKSTFGDSPKFGDSHSFGSFGDSHSFGEGSKFGDSSNFKVSSDFKVGSESHSPVQYQKSQNTKFGGEFSKFKPNFRLQEVPNLYPSEDQFKPSLGYPGESSGLSGQNSNNGNKLFEPSSDNEEFVQQQLAKNPASKGQYQQYLKSQEDEKIEQQALLEQLQYQQHQQPQKPKGPPKAPISRPSSAFSGSSAKFRPYITVKKTYPRKRPLVRVASSPGLSHYRTPAIDGPYTIHFSV